jgi:hypothetical protein
MAKSIRCVHVKIFAPHNRGFGRKVFRASPHCFFTEKGIDDLLEKVAEWIEQLHPEHEYSMVQIAADQFNFVWRSEKTASRAEQAA